MSFWDDLQEKASQAWSENKGRLSESAAGKIADWTSDQMLRALDSPSEQPYQAVNSPMQGVPLRPEQARPVTAQPFDLSSVTGEKIGGVGVPLILGIVVAVIVVKRAL